MYKEAIVDFHFEFQHWTNECYWAKTQDHYDYWRVADDLGLFYEGNYEFVQNFKENLT